MPVIRRRDAIAIGFGDKQIQRMRLTGRWDRLRSGAYLPVASTQPWPEERHRLLIEAMLPAMDDRAAISHQSAGVVHGIDLWGLPLDVLHVSRPGSGGGHRRRWMHTHTTPLDSDDIVLVDGIPVTSIARTLLDLGRSNGFESAVVAMDSALHLQLLAPDDLAKLLARMRYWPGASRAARAIAFADGLSESVGESRSRVQIFRAGLPSPQLQVELFSRDGEFLGRTDFLFKDQHTAAEFDGRTKYGRLLVPGGGETPTPDRIAAAIVTEKFREDAIRQMPLSVARWGWAALETHSVPSILRRASRLERRCLPWLGEATHRVQPRPHATRAPLLLPRAGSYRRGRQEPARDKNKACRVGRQDPRCVVRGRTLPALGPQRPDRTPPARHFSYHAPVATGAAGKNRRATTTERARQREEPSAPGDPGSTDHARDPT